MDFYKDLKKYKKPYNNRIEALLYDKNKYTYDQALKDLLSRGYIDFNIITTNEHYIFEQITPLTHPNIKKYLLPLTKDIKIIKYLI